MRSGSPMSPRDLRAIRIGVAAIAVTLLVGKVVPTLSLERAELATRRERASATLSLVQRRRDDLRGLGGEWRDPAGTREAVGFVGATPTASAARGAAFVSDLARARGATVLSVHPQSAEEFSSSAAVFALRVDLTIDGSGLRRLLADLESGPRQLIVVALDVSQSDPVPVVGRAEVLRVDMTVEAIAVLAHGADQ